MCAPKNQTEKMTIVDSLLYCGILCLHYPLKLGFEATRTTKAVVVTTVSLPKRTFNLAISVVKGTKHVIEETVSGAISIVQNVFAKILGTAKQVGEASSNTYTQLKGVPKNQYERAYEKFQSVAFDRERQELQQEIRKLRDEINKGKQNKSGGDKERQKCDRQILDLQEQLTRIHLSYTQQKQQMVGDFDKEKAKSKQEIKTLNQKLTQAQLNFEKTAKKQVADFDKERQQYQNEIQKLNQRINVLQEELADDSNDSDVDADTNDKTAAPAKETEEPSVDDKEVQHVAESLKTIDEVQEHSIKLSERIAKFVGTEKSKAFLDISDLLIKNMIKLDEIESKGHNVIRRGKKEALKFIQKCKADLKEKAAKETS